MRNGAQLTVFRSFRHHYVTVKAHLGTDDYYLASTHNIPFDQLTKHTR
jgi:hypothetical protein